MNPRIHDAVAAASSYCSPSRPAATRRLSSGDRFCDSLSLASNRFTLIRKPTMAPTIAREPFGVEAELPGRGAACFEAVNHQVENGACLGGIARELDRAVRVRDRVVPRRHRAGRIGVPRRRNVRMRPVEDGDRFRAGGDLRVRIGAGEMAEQRAVRLAVGDMQQRQVRHQRLGRVRA